MEDFYYSLSFGQGDTSQSFEFKTCNELLTFIEEAFDVTVVYNEDLEDTED